MKNPIVTIEMENGGVIKAELYPEIAPNTVRNFIDLIDRGFYDGFKEDAQKAQEWEVQGIELKVNSQEMDLKMN